MVSRAGPRRPASRFPRRAVGQRRPPPGDTRDHAALLTGDSLGTSCPLDAGAHALSKHSRIRCHGAQFIKQPQWHGIHDRSLMVLRVVSREDREQFGLRREVRKHRAIGFGRLHGAQEKHAPTVATSS
jgi:hypothetical protein